MARDFWYDSKYKRFGTENIPGIFRARHLFAYLPKKVKVEFSYNKKGDSFIFKWIWWKHYVIIEQAVDGVSVEGKREYQWIVKSTEIFK